MAFEEWSRKMNLQTPIITFQKPIIQYFPTIAKIVITIGVILFYVFKEKRG